MANVRKGLIEMAFACKPADKERWRACATARGLPLATWFRQIADEECERQAALLLYQIRVERPHELNAILEETIRQHAISKCPKRKTHQVGVYCETCRQHPHLSLTP